jgi:hypothetical protein
MVRRGVVCVPVINFLGHMQPASSLLKRGEPLDVGIPSGIKPKEEQQRRNLRMLPTSVAAIKKDGAAEN